MYLKYILAVHFSYEMSICILLYILILFIATINVIKVDDLVFYFITLYFQYVVPSVFIVPEVSIDNACNGWP